MGKDQFMDKYRVLTISNTEDIIRRLKKDDKSAVDELFGYYYPRLYHFSKSILKIETGIDDILQEVFVKIWLNRQKIGNVETFNSYILSLIHISEPTRLGMISYAVFCLK